MNYRGECLQSVSEFKKGELQTYRIGSDSYGAADRAAKKRDRINGLKIVRYLTDRALNVYMANRRGELVMVRTDG